MNPLGFVFVFVGLFSFVGAALDWEWFVNSSKAQFLISLIGRRGTRIFYGTLGLVIIVLGFVVLLEDSSSFR